MRLYAIKHGYLDGLNIAFATWVLLYLGLAVAMRFFGASLIVAAIVAIPIAVGVVAFRLSQLAQRRRRLFNRQFLEALNLIANQLESGSGPQRAIEQVIPNLSDPLQTELSVAMDRALVSKDMVSAIAELQDRYPSKALKLFVAALELNRDAAAGGRLEPSIRNAANIMQAQFELSDETIAELSETRSEFMALIVVIIGIAIVMFTAGGSVSAHAYYSTFGIIATGLATIWFAVGVYLSFRLLNRGRGDS
jgi:tight adherence protein B